MITLILHFFSDKPGFISPYEATREVNLFKKKNVQATGGDKFLAGPRNGSHLTRVRETGWRRLSEVPDAG